MKNRSEQALNILCKNKIFGVATEYVLTGVFRPFVGFLPEYPSGE